MQTQFSDISSCFASYSEQNKLLINFHYIEIVDFSFSPLSFNRRLQRRQLLNLSDIAMNCGISVPTASKWFSILEASYILFRLQPHFTNFNKRITKTPKLYFYDTGLVGALLQINSQDTLSVSHFRGNLFENLMISDLYKQFYNQGKRPPLYFWRDKNGTLEVDCVVDKGTELIPIEIKASETILSTFFRTMIKWNELSHTDPHNNYLIYAGTEQQTRKHGHMVGWKAAGELIEKLDA